MAQKTVLRVAFFAASGSAWNPLCRKYVVQANAMLAPHNISIQEYPAGVSTGASPITLPQLFYNISVDSTKSMLHIRDECARVQTSDQGIPVIFLDAKGVMDSHGTVPPAKWFGLTLPPSSQYLMDGKPINVTWPAFVFINTLKHATRDMALCHELIHAAGLPDLYDKNKVGDIMYGHQKGDDDTTPLNNNNVVVTSQEAAALRRAYFARAVR